MKYKPGYLSAALGLTLNIVCLVVSLSLGACSTTLQEGPYAPQLVDASRTTPPTDLGPITRFAFGSCNKQYLPQPLWKKIIEDKPELFVWTGDVVYADTRDMGKLSQIYASALNQPEYAGFLASKIPVIGIWDDHDYGENNGGKDFPPKVTSQKLFLDFMGEPAASPRRQQKGIYTRYVFGQGPTALRFILLDTRYNRTSKGEGDILGEDQWQWLEKELKTDLGAITFIVSSIQVLPFEQNFEKWANFPKSRTRLLQLMDASPSKNIMIISGDRHLAELSHQVTPGKKDLWEITSSGLTHSFRNPDEARNKNSLRVGPVFDRLHYGLIDYDATQKTVRIQVRDLNRTAGIDQTVQLK